MLQCYKRNSSTYTPAIVPFSFRQTPRWRSSSRHSWQNKCAAEMFCLPRQTPTWESVFWFSIRSSMQPMSWFCILRGHDCQFTKQIEANHAFIFNRWNQKGNFAQQIVMLLTFRHLGKSVTKQMFLFARHSYAITVKNISRWFLSNHLKLHNQLAYHSMQQHLHSMRPHYHAVLQNPNIAKLFNLMRETMHHITTTRL